MKSENLRWAPFLQPASCIVAGGPGKETVNSKRTKSWFVHFTRNYELVISRNLVVFLVSAACLTLPTQGLSDDVGITKARLIQQDDSTYILEADINAQLAGTIRNPMFPARFRVSEMEFDTREGWIIARSTIVTGGSPLQPEDEILLPWTRYGVDLTVQWLDGSVHQGLFLRNPEGIRIPINMVMSPRRTLVEVLLQSFQLGLHHFTFKSVHWLLMLALVLAFNGFTWIRPLVALAFGQGMSLVLSELGIPGFDLLLTDMLLATVVIFLSGAAAKNDGSWSFVYLLVLLGVFHGLSYNQELSSMDVEPSQRVPAIFAFNLALDLCGFGVATALGLLSILVVWKWISRIGAYVTGSIGVALILILFQENVLNRKTDILGIRPQESVYQFGLPEDLSRQGGQKPVGILRMNTPVMAFLTVEPFEVRQEILVNARAGAGLLGLNDTGTGAIPVAAQEVFKSRLLAMVLDSNSLRVDGERLEPMLSRADFVFLGAGGVVVRETPRTESLDQGTVGITLVYSTENLPKSACVDWNVFPSDGSAVEAATVDPFATSSQILTPADNSLRWEARLSNFSVPVLERIAVEQPRLPLFSIILFLLVIILVAFWRARGQRPRSNLALTLSSLALVLYPFARPALDLPVVSRWKPSIERSSDILGKLLTNVYRSFEVRDEEKVYDRLALSVSGEQLTDIFLENRQALELENRGGARAQVDQVEILDVSYVTTTQEGYVAQTLWRVSGSVSHFGHTHYRQNQYLANVTFAPIESSWKIKKIEVLDQERLL